MDIGEGPRDHRS